MTTTIPSIDIVMSVHPLFTAGERTASAEFLAGNNGLTRDAYALDLRMYTAWCQQHGPAAVPGRAPGHRVLRARHGPAGLPGPRSRVDCARSPGATGSPSRKNCSTTRRPATCGARAWTTSPTPSVWTATRSVRCSWVRPATRVTRSGRRVGGLHGGRRPGW